MNNSRSILFLALNCMCFCVTASYDEVQNIPIEMVLSAEKSNFVMMKTNDGPIWLIHRSKEQIEYLESNYPPGADASNLLRSTRPDIFVVKPKCSCTGDTARYLEPGHPMLGGGIPGGFLCERDWSLLDLAGRVIASTCDGKDFEIPKYKVKDDEFIEIDPNDT